MTSQAYMISGDPMLRLCKLDLIKCACILCEYGYRGECLARLMSCLSISHWSVYLHYGTSHAWRMYPSSILFMSNMQLLVQAVPRVCTSSCQSIIYPVHLQDILLIKSIRRKKNISIVGPSMHSIPIFPTYKQTLNMTKLEHFQANEQVS